MNFYYWMRTNTGTDVKTSEWWVSKLVYNYRDVDIRLLHHFTLSTASDVPLQIHLVDLMIIQSFFAVYCSLKMYAVHIAFHVVKLEF